MRLARIAVTGGIIVAAGVAVGSAGPAEAASAAEAISVSPSPAHAGELVSISVTDCSVGPTRHWASSPAFDKDVTLGGKADTGDAGARLSKGLAPGKYPITAHCGNSTPVKGTVTVVPGKPRPDKPGDIGVYSPTPTPAPTTPYATISARPAASHSDGSSSAPYWGVGGGAIVLAGLGTAYLIRRRARRG